MAKVEGPLFSLRARGSIEKTLTFQTTKAGQIVKLYKVPPDPKTDSQLKSRSDFQQAAKYYRELSPDDRQAWKVLTYEHNYTGYAGFMQTCKTTLASGKEWINLKKIIISDITKNTALIKANTDIPAGIKVIYGYKPGKLHLDFAEEEPYSLNPEITLLDLFMRTRYYFRLTLITPENQYGITGLYSFMTAAE
jgi:hypothetical protein